MTSALPRAIMATSAPASASAVANARPSPRLAPGREGGAYLRVIPRRVIIMTLPVPPGADPAATAATPGAELAALVSLAEAG